MCEFMQGRLFDRSERRTSSSGVLGGSRRSGLVEHDSSPFWLFRDDRQDEPVYLSS